MSAAHPSPSLSDPQVLVEALLAAADLGELAAALQQGCEAMGVDLCLVSCVGPSQVDKPWQVHPLRRLDVGDVRLLSGFSNSREVGTRLIDAEDPRHWAQLLARDGSYWIALLAQGPCPSEMEGILHLATLRAGSMFKAERLKLDVQRLASAERLQRALYAISDFANDASIDMDRMLHHVHEVVARLMYAENFFIARYLTDPERVQFIYYADTQDQEEVDPSRFYEQEEVENSLTLAMLRHGLAVRGPSEHIRESLGVPRDMRHGPDAEDWLGVPMRDETGVRGAVVVQSYDGDVHYREEDQLLLSYVAQHILTALDRREAQQRLEQRVEERTRALREEMAQRNRGERLQAALFRITELAGREIDPQHFYPQLHKVIGELLDARNFFIAVLDTAREQLVFPYSVDQNDSYRPPRRLARGLTEYVLRSGRPQLLRRPDIERLARMGEVQSFGVPSACWLGAPLLIDGVAEGVIAVQSYEDESQFTQQDQELLSFVSIHVATVIERKRDEEWLRRANIELEARVEERTQALADSNRELRDQIVVREHIEERLKHQVMHDALTGLPNRNQLLARMARCLQAYHRSPQEENFAVLFLDLDRFKVVNDSVGHLVGDELLKEAAKRIAHCVREPDLVARLGGDEFCVVLGQLQSAADAIHVAERIIDALGAPMRIQGKELYTSTSIGIALAHPRYQRAEDLLRDADVAMYHAKAQGRRRHALFDEELHAQAMQALEMDSELRKALAAREFLPYYQPIIQLESRQVQGFEALMRWQHRSKGMLSPEHFLALAEETGTLEQMDWLIFESVCRDIPELIDGEQYVSINVAPRHLRDEGFVAKLIGLIDRYRVRPQQVQIEITEGALLEQPDLVQHVLTQLRDCGVRTMLDDFGTGYSSLSYLHRFPLHGLKIDRSFVNSLRIGSETGSSAIVQAIRLLANTLNIQVIAEGVETEEQRIQLRSLGIALGQGYLFAKPQPKAHWLAQMSQA